MTGGHAGREERLHTDGLRLVLSCRRRAVGVGRVPTVTVQFCNDTDRSVLLVEPGSGSEFGWRTPAIAWSIMKKGVGEAAHPLTPPLIELPLTCPNVKGLQDYRLFEIAPRRREKIKRLHPLFWPKEPGRYGLVFYYESDPQHAQHESLVTDVTKERVARSLKCLLISNELEIDVVE